MTAPTMLPPLCPDCGDPTRKHDDTGCTAHGGRCLCTQTRATLAAALDELPAPPPAVFVEPAAPEPVEVPDAPTPAGTDPAADGGPVETSAADLPADPAAPDVTTDCPAGSDVSPDRPRGDLPGTNPAPDFGGREEAAPPAAEPAAETLDPPRASAADGQLLGSYITWHCPHCLAGRELPAPRCCGTPLIRARVTVRREPTDA